MLYDKVKIKEVLKRVFNVKRPFGEGGEKRRGWDRRMSRLFDLYFWFFLYFFFFLF
jgi:hypothetical protein